MNNNRTRAPRDRISTQKVVCFRIQKAVSVRSCSKRKANQVEMSKKKKEKKKKLNIMISEILRKRLLE